MNTQQLKTINMEAVNSFPEHTGLWGNTVMINIGGKSPDWVLNLLKTMKGTELLIQSLRELYLIETRLDECHYLKEGNIDG